MKRIRIVLLAVIIISVFILASVTSGEAMTEMENGWKYYRDITIKENSGKDLRDYQVFVAFNPSNFPEKAKKDGADIRFTDANGKELSYWIESWDYSGKSAKIWVKVPKIPANGETKITMRYGNPSASSQSDGDATFEFFDDFEKGLSKWTYPGDITVTTTALNQLKIYHNGHNSRCIFGGVNSKQTFNKADIGDFKVIFKDIDFTLNSEENNFVFGLLEKSHNPSDNAEAFVGNKAIYQRIEPHINSFETTYSGSTKNTPLSINWHASHNTEIIFLGNKAELVVDGNTVATHTIHYVGDSDYEIVVNNEDDADSSVPEEIKVDFIFVSKYTHPEPTVTVEAEQPDPKTAIEEAKTKISEANSRGSDLTQAELLLEEAEQALENGDYGKAIELAKQAKKKAEMVILAHNILTATVIAVVIFIVVSVVRILRKR